MTTELPEDYCRPHADQPLALKLSEGLGPLPDAAGVMAQGEHAMRRAFTAEQMRAYAAQEVAAERERFIEALADACLAAEIPDSKYESLLIALRA